MNLQNEEVVKKILEIVAEAKKYNYPEFNLKLDLDKYITEELNKEYDSGYDQGYSDADSERTSW